MSHTDLSEWRDTRFDALAGEWGRMAGLAVVGGDDGLLGIEYDGSTPRMIVLYRPATLRATAAPLTTRALASLQTRVRLPTQVCSYWPDADQPGFEPCRLDGTHLVDGVDIWTEQQWVGMLHAARRRPLPDGLDLADSASRVRAVDYQCRWLSHRHRRWGPDAPMVAIDCLLYDPAAGEPVAIVDGKCAVDADGARIAQARHLAAAGLHDEPPHPSYLAVKRLADLARIAAFVVLYSHRHDWIRVWPTNGHAKEICEPGEGLTTTAWAVRLAELAGSADRAPRIDAPQPVHGTVWRAPDDTVCPPDPHRPGYCGWCKLRFAGEHPFGCAPMHEEAA